MLALASFNIFWFPSAATPRNARSGEDERLLGQVIGHLAADVLVFQEILDPQRLAELLGQVPGRDYQVCVTSPATGPGTAKNQMHVVLAFDGSRIQCLGAAILIDPAIAAKQGRRLPVVGHFRETSSGSEFVAVGVHLKSGLPNPLAASAEDTATTRRRQEVDHIAKWLAGNGGGGFGEFAQPPSRDVVLLGDFNLVAGNHLLGPLTAGPLSGWRWLKTKVRSTLDAGAAAVNRPGEQWSTFLDRVFIDHVLVSPSLRPKVKGASTTTYAFDLAPMFAPHALRQKQGYQCIPYQGAPFGVVENLYRVSDHRPVRVSFDTP